MHTTQPEVPATAIVGNVIDLGEGRSAAIYRRDGSSWVAEFQGGRGRLVDVPGWFRARGGALRHGRGGRAALETMVPITPELSEQIERLHRPTSAGDTRVSRSRRWSCRRSNAGASKWAASCETAFRAGLAFG